ncbi:MAG: zf-HC2 domain-containing protein [Terriglobales bacterium]|jgi:hypothetical protein
MKCALAKSLLSPYLDGALTGKQMLALSAHLHACEDCATSYAGLQGAQRLLAGMERRKAPADLELKLRLAISRESARAQNLRLHGWGIQLRHALQVFMVPATAGLVATVVLFGVLTAFLAPPLEAGNRDVPLVIQTAPQLERSDFGTSGNSIKEDSLVIEAYVDSNGRVSDYRILSNPGQEQDLPVQVKNMLIFTTFRPATLMGHPTAGRAVMSFSKINVKG